MLRKYFLSFFLTILLVVIFFTPFLASAHEVYVLSPAEIQIALHTPSVPFLTVLHENLKLFSFWAFLGILAVVSIFLLSIMRIMEKTFDPFFLKTKKWGPIISRITVGVSFLAAAYYQASYGPELPLRAAYGSYTPIITVILIIIGILIITDIYVEIAAFIALLLYAFAVYKHGWYMLTYVNYLGEIILLLTIGFKKLKPYGFLILRVFFGIALIYTSFYAKILYSNLALMTVTKYSLTRYLHFEPHFLVLGAACVEILIGTFFILGIEIRATAIFLLFWLAQSLLFFGEVVWPHIILIGIPIAFFFYGYDKYSIEGYFFKKGNTEPVL